MSDSDSVSDSDVSQGWTFVGPEGTVDSSDHDSEIVVLKDDEIQMKNLSEVDYTKVKTEFQFGEGSQSEARVKNHEADLESKAAFCDTDFRQKTSHAFSDVESETPETGLVLDKTAGVILAAGEAEILKMSAEENRESSSGEIESLAKGFDAENCMEMGNVETASRRQSDDNGPLLNERLNTAREIAESVNQRELSDLEEISPESLLNCSLQVSSCLQSGFTASTLERSTNVSGSVCSDSKSKEEEFSEGEVNADDDDDDDDDEEDEDDDESVVRKFHEATLLGSFNRSPLHADERNESQQIIEEDEFLPPDIDDRCESDISGVADDSDSDLSSLVGIEDLPLHAGDVVRTYRHQPNPRFNKCLTFIAATAMLLAVGIGIGHFIGSTRESSVHQRQLLHLKMLQDEYFVCLRDIEKLESRLVEARHHSDTQEKIAAVTAVWKKKYEELVLERAELEYRLNQMQDRVKAMLFLKERSEENARKIEDMNEQELSGKLTEQKLEIAEPSRTLCGNDLENKAKSNLKPKDLDQESKGKLLSANVTHKPIGPASNVPGNVSETHAPISAEETVTECHKQVDGLKIILEKKNFEIDVLRNNADQMTVENADLKTAIQNQRYKERLGNVKRSKEKAAKVKQADRHMAGAVSYGKRKQKMETGYREQRHVDKPNSQFKILNSNQGEKKESVNMPKWRQSTISLLKVFTAQLSFDSESSTPYDYESIVNLTSCFAALQNISTGSHSLFDFVSSEALNGEGVVKQMDVLKCQVKKILDLCQNSVNYENSVNERKIKFNKFLRVSMSQQENETLQYHAKFVQKFLKQLRSVVQGFVRSIDSFPKAATAKGDKHKMKTEMKNWAHRMKSSWKKMEEAVSLIKSQKQRSGYTWKEPWQMSNVRETEVHGSVLRPVGEKSNQAFDGNRDHKQTESSSSSSHQRYEEFWRWNHFDPDDFLQEGFFEDNQREWHKHQKRLRKINGRIQRLTEEILLSMDDDDIEDIYEDIDDFADDVEDREIPEQLRTWLSCQTRWWRSRVHRKHRNEDLVKGCGQQLMHWQLRVLCKEKSGRIRDQEELIYDYDRFCKAVISSQGQGLNSKYFIMDASLFKQGAKDGEWKHFSPKTMHAEQLTVDRLMNLSGEYKVENITFTDHSAYGCDSFSKRHYQSDLPVKSSYFANVAFGRAATGHGPQHDQSLNCHEEGKFCRKLVQEDKQWCEK